MNELRMLEDHSGTLWRIECRESGRLRTIGGFLVTDDGEGCLTMSTYLSPDDKTRGCDLLLNGLREGRVPRRGVRLWHPEEG